MKAKAAVLVGDSTIETREIDVPDAPPPGGALLAVEGCGMCGSDIEQYHGGNRPRRHPWGTLRGGRLLAGEVPRQQALHISMIAGA